MSQKLKNYILSIIGAAVLLVPALVPAAVSAQSSVNNDVTGQLCQGVDNASNGNQISLNPSTSNDAGSCTNDSSAGNTLGGILNTVINVFSLVVGAVAVIMIIVGGFRYIISGGSDQNMAGAKNTIIWALVGLVIVALAQVIVHYVINRISS